MKGIARVAGLGIAVACTWLAGCSASGLKQGNGQAGVPILACRLANYGPYEEAGYRHLESIGIRHVFISVPAPDQVAAVQKKLADHHLEPVVMRGNADLSKDGCVEELATQAATCRAMGVRYMFLSAKPNGAPVPAVCERLRRAGEAARKQGVTIVLETHPPLGTNAEVQAETMRQINHPNVRVNFDTGNITYYNHGTSAPAELKKIIGQVATVEVKDHDGKFESWNFPALGKGAVDLKSVLALLKERGYSGPVTMEIEGVKGQDRTEAQIRKDIEDSVAYLRSIEQFR
jgi:sugar phosphate isomerase/epimerase